VVDIFLEEVPDTSLVPPIDKAVFHANAAVALESTPNQKARATLVLGKALAGSDRYRLMSLKEEQKLKTDSANRETDRAKKALAELAEASKANSTSRAGMKLLGNRSKKGSAQQAAEKAELKKQKVAIDMAKQTMEGKLKAATYEESQFLAAMERTDPWIVPSFALPEGATPHEFADGSLSTAGQFALPCNYYVN